MENLGWWTLLPLYWLQITFWPTFGTYSGVVEAGNLQAPAWLWKSNSLWALLHHTCRCRIHKPKLILITTPTPGHTHLYHYTYFFAWPIKNCLLRAWRVFVCMCACVFVLLRYVLSMAMALWWLSSKVFCQWSMGFLAWSPTRWIVLSLNFIPLSHHPPSLQMGK